MKNWFKENWILLLLIICISAITICITAGLTQQKRNDIEYLYNLNCYKEAELKYWENKSKLITEVQNYIEYVAPTSNLRAYELVDKCEETFIDLKFVLAQGAIESAFGTKGLASRTNSVWNLGAFDTLTYNKVDKKYKYRHPNESIEPYFHLLITKYLVDKMEIDLMNNYVDSNGNRYASDEHYEEKLRAKYKEIDEITHIDSLQAIVRHYAIKCNR